jgi:hypothetical protein
MQNAGAHGHLKRIRLMLDSLRMSDSLGAPTERCLSKIAHWNEQIYYLVATFPPQGQVRTPPRGIRLQAIEWLPSFSLMRRWHGRSSREVNSLRENPGSEAGCGTPQRSARAAAKTSAAL